MRLSVEILQLQTSHLKTPGSIVLRYLRDPTFSRFHKIPECDRHTQTNRRTDRQTTTACTVLSIASRGKNRANYAFICSKQNFWYCEYKQFKNSLSEVPKSRNGTNNLASHFSANARP